MTVPDIAEHLGVAAAPAAATSAAPARATTAASARAAKADGAQQSQIPMTVDQMQSNMYKVQQQGIVSAA